MCTLGRWTNVIACRFLDGGSWDATYGQTNVQYIEWSMQEMAWLDVDKDGMVDVTTGIDFNTGKVGYRFSRGANTWGPQVVINAGGAGYRVGMGDFTGSGLADLAAGQYYNGRISVWLDLVDGAPAPPRVDLATPGGTVSYLGAGDLNGDGAQEVLTSTHTIDQVAYYQHVSGTTFVGPVIITSAFVSPNRMTLFDYDSDGDPDILVALSAAGGVFIIPNLADTLAPNATGTILLGDVEPVPLIPEATGSVTFVDVNGDGHEDFLSADGDGVFYYPARELPLDYGPKLYLTTGSSRMPVFGPDFNADGIPDLAYGRTDTSRAMVAHNVPVSATSSDATVISHGGHSGNTLIWSAGADFNGDGLMDLAYCLDGWGVDRVRYKPGTALGEFSTTDITMAVRNCPRFGATVDLDRDTWPDVMFGSGTNAFYIVNDGSAFSGKINLEYTTGTIYGMTSADFDGDGKTDLLYTTSAQIVWYRQITGASPGAPVTFGGKEVVTSSAGLQFPFVGDFDGNGRPDILGHATTLFLNKDINGTDAPVWEEVVFPRDGHTVIAALGADLDASGTLDLVWASSSSSLVMWAPNTGSAVFGPLATVATPSGPQYLAFAPWNSDTSLDLVVATASSVFVYANNGAGVFDPTPLVSVTGKDRFYQARVMDLDADGDPDILYALNRAGGALPGDVGWIKNRQRSPIPSYTAKVVAFVARPTSEPSICQRDAMAGSRLTMACVLERIGYASACATDTVLLKPGVYTACFDSHVVLDKSVHLKADGPPGSVVFDCSLDGGGGVLFKVTGPRTLILDGIDVVGMTSAADPVVSPGPGLVVQSRTSELLIFNAVIRSCSSAPASALTNNLGGVILAAEGSLVVASNVSFVSNAAGAFAGAVAAVDAGTLVRLANVTFSGNAAGNGGALGLASGASAELSGSVTFSNNQATTGSGGALVVSSGATLTLSPLTSLVCVGNGAVERGGALAFDGQGSHLEVPPSAFLELKTNTAGVSGGGLALTSHASGTLAALVAESNVALSLAGSGRGGAVVVEYGAVLSLTGASFEGNTGAYGGAVALVGPAASLSVTHTVFTGNTASVRGGAFDAEGGYALPALLSGSGGASHSTATFENATFGANVGLGAGGTVAAVGWPAGAGGAVDVVLADSLIYSSSAHVAGGAFYLAGHDETSGATLSLPGTRVVQASAGKWGGMFACVPPQYELEAGTSSADLVRATSLSPSTHVNASGALFGASASAFGGLVFDCGCTWDLPSPDAGGSLGTSSASIAGGFVFACSATALDPGLGAHDGAQESSVSSSSGGYGPFRATPPVVLQWTSAGDMPPAFASVGEPLTRGSLVLFDAFGQAVRGDASLVLSLSLAETTVAAGGSLLDADTVFALIPPTLAVPNPDDGSYYFGESGVSMLLSPLQTGTDTASRDEAVVGSVLLQVSLAASVAPVTSQLTLTLCQPGHGLTGLTPLGHSLCSVCEEFTTTPTYSTAPCAPCSELSSITSTSNSTCVCNPGAFTREGVPNSVCLPCPVGGECPGALAKPRPKPGFFDADDTGETFVQCLRPEACPGGGGCTEGYQGYMCNSCSTGYFTTSDDKCTPCPSNGALYASLLYSFVAVIAAVLLLALVFFMWRSGKAAERIAEFGPRSRGLPATIPMSITAMQIMVLIAKSPLSWPDSAKRLLLTFDFVNVNIGDIFASECSLSSYHKAYVFSVVASVAIIGLLCIIAGILTLVAPSIPFLRSLPKPLVGLEALFISLGPLAYIPLSRTVLSHFACRKLPDSSWAISSNPGIPCYDSAWMQAAWGGVFGVLIIVLGLPAYFSIRIWANKASLWEPHVLARLGGLYSLFRKPYYYLEVVNLMRRLAVVAASLFLATEPLLLLGTLAGLFGTLMVFFARARPHFFPLYTQAEFRLSVALTLILLLGGAAYAETGENSAAITVLVYAACALLICLAVALIVQDIYDMFRSRRSSNKATQRAPDYHLARYVRSMVAPFLDDLEDTNVANAINANLDTYVAGGLWDSERGTATGIELAALDEDDGLSPASSMLSSSSSKDEDEEASSEPVSASVPSSVSRSSRWSGRRSSRRVAPGTAPGSLSAARAAARAAARDNALDTTLDNTLFGEDQVWDGE